MQVIRRADRDIVQRARGFSLQAVCMLEEKFKLGEELALRRDAVDDAHRIIDVVGRDQAVASVFDGPHMPGGNVTSGADQCEILHELSLPNR
ncbi:hypothetical protein D3C80_1781330 [compost metagenome]